MAEFLDYEGLRIYHRKMKKYVNSEDEKIKNELADESLSSADIDAALK